MMVIRKCIFSKSRKLLDWVLIYLQLYRFEHVRLLIWCSTYILISIGVLDTSSCFFHFSITCGDIIHWVATIVINDICSKIDQNNIKKSFWVSIQQFLPKIIKSRCSVIKVPSQSAIFVAQNFFCKV